ncbi:hypothetical protein GP486_008312, partial [Trichoglossum hirsutum]
MDASQGYTEYLHNPFSFDFLDNEFHNSWNSPDANLLPWSSQRTLFEDEKLNYGSGTMSSNTTRVYADSMMGAQSPYPYPTPIFGSSRSMCSDDTVDPCPSSTESDWSPRASVADLQLETRQHNLDYRRRCSPPREWQDKLLPQSILAGAANMAGVYNIQGTQGIVCPKEVQINASFMDEEEADVTAYDDPNQMDCGSEHHPYGQDPSDTIVLESQRGPYVGDGCDTSANGVSLSDEEDGEDDACSSYSDTKGGNIIRRDPVQQRQQQQQQQNKRSERASGNSFNRKDLFTQHLRRMHLPKSSSHHSGGSLTKSAAAEQQLPEIWKRCCKVQREAPTSSTCGYCGKRFQGPGSWDERMEHVGHHYENSREPVNPGDWKEDKELTQWMLREGLIRPKDEGSIDSGYTVFGVGNKPSRRKSDDEFSDGGDRKNNNAHDHLA